jgi:hypothetical protein
LRFYIDTWKINVTDYKIRLGVKECGTNKNKKRNKVNKWRWCSLRLIIKGENKMLAKNKRALKTGLSKKMKAVAEIRQCPNCKRKNAISKLKDDGWTTKWCRYCDYEDGYFTKP